MMVDSMNQSSLVITRLPVFLAFHTIILFSKYAMNYSDVISQYSGTIFLIFLSNFVEKLDFSAAFSQHLRNLNIF